MPKTMPSQILVELSSTFAAEIARGGCTLAQDTNAKFEELFGKTVGAGLDERPDAWKPEAERYIVKVVGRIARDACTVANELQGGTVTAQILNDVASDVIAEQQLVCSRAEEMLAKRGAQAFGVKGMFCKSYVVE